MLALTILSLLVAATCGGFALYLHLEERRRSEARVAALAAAIGQAERVDSARRAADSADALFSARTAPMESRRLLLSLAAAAGIGLVVVSALLVTGGSSAGAAAASAPGPQLDLLSMRHTREDQALIITGLVRNSGSAPAARVSAAVYAFDRHGEFAGSGEGRLPFDTLSAGDEAPFHVRIPHAADVARYRVSFRAAAGPIRHVDRRADRQTRAPASP